MDFSFTPAQQAFRQELRDFLQAELGDLESRSSERAVIGAARYDQSFSKKLHKKGWIGLAWPKEYGGQGLGHIERLVYNEEMTYWRAPTGFHFMSERQMGPSFMLYGNEEQKKEYLPAIIQGDICFCIGYSEPEAGSDLAGLKTRATLDGDDFVVNGQKIWTSGAHHATHCWLAVRTDPDAPKHKGISVLVVDMKSPGVQVRPLYNLMNSHEFNEVFFDNVRVPKRNLVGELNRGWYVVANNLDFERAGIERVIENELLFRRVLKYVKRGKVDGAGLNTAPALRHRLAEMALEFQVGRLLSYRVAWIMSQNRVPNHEASQAKVFGSELSQRVTGLLEQVLGPFGQLESESPWVPFDGAVERSFLSALSDTIRGGTSEVQRNIIAGRGLGLPRG
jgi:alkylation response protein AidB-like acyl-CoA dehydrogenase